MAHTEKIAPSYTFRPLGEYERIGLCRDSCVPLSVLDVMATWHRAATELQKGGVIYPGIYFPIPNQLLREQTNINDGNTLRALPDIKSQAGKIYKALDGAVQTHNTPVCRHFMHWLQSDIMPQSVFPALEKGTGNDEVNRIKAIMYYVLWHENQDQARQLGAPPDMLTKNPGVTYDEVKERGEDFKHITFTKKSGRIALHHALVTGIRGSRLWPWNDPHFKDETGAVKPVLSDFHFNLADLSMLSMFMNGITQNPGDISDPRNHLVIFVSNDTEFMREISEFAYGHRVVKSTVDGSRYRKFVEEYNELSRQIEETQNKLRRNARNGRQKSDDSRQAIGRIVKLKQDRKELREKLEEPLKNNGLKATKSHVVPLLPEEYERYDARGLVIAQPPPYAERPDILVLSTRRFLDAMKAHYHEMELLVRRSRERLTNRDTVLKTMRALKTEIQKLETDLGEGQLTQHQSPDSIFGLQKTLREHVERQNGRGNGHRL